MSVDTHLIITHGTSDLQILLRDKSGRLWRAMPDKTFVRRFHERLLQHTSEAEVIDIPDELLDRKHEASFTDWQEDTFALWLNEGSLDAHPERNAEGRLQLVLPKIEPALTQWLNKQNQPDISSFAQTLLNAGVKASPLHKVLVLSTDRGEDEQEPVATFTFLKHWLMSKNVPEDAISEVVFLHPGERLESGDSPIAIKIANRIEKAVVDFYPRNTNATLLIASMGGLPQIKPLLAELAVLLAGSQAQNLFKTERGGLGLLAQTPIDALRVRRQCLQQIKRGALLDAWAMATPFHNDLDARIWVRPLEQAARLLNGNPAGEHVELPALQRIIKHAERTACLLVAIRVETALLNEHWLEAINGTITFLEAAFHDAINKWTKQTRVKYNPRNRYMLFRETPATVLFEKNALSEWKGREATSLTYQANIIGKEALSAWDEVLNIASIHRLRKTIHETVRLSDGSSFRLSDYRNFNTHGVLTQSEIDEAIKRFMGTDLWAQGLNNPSSRPKPGKCFLGRKLVSDVIDDLIDDDNTKAEASATNLAETLYQELLQQLESCLIDPTSPLL